jgi:voltage-gated potassium channel
LLSKNEHHSMTSEANRERRKLLTRLEDLFEGPLIVLGFIWLILLVVELVFEPNPILEAISVVIWIIFIIDFLLKFILAPKKGTYLKSNVLTLISLVVPAFRLFRLFRVFRILRLSRSLRLVKVVGSLSRGMRALSATMQRRAFGYVVLLTVIVIFGGAAGMYAFEKDVAGGLTNYGTALWWTTMIMTTLGSEYWPQTPEGRVLCIILSLFAFAIFGYITATIATFFLGRDAENEKSEFAGTKQVEALRKEIISLREMVKELQNKL